MKNTSMKSLIAAASLMLAVGAGAQDLVHKAPPQSRPIVIENATIHTVSGGVIEGGTVVFDSGVITQVLRAGERVRVRGDAERIDAAGKHVFPGFISAVTGLGLVEVNSVRATVDTSEVGAIKPEVRGAVAVNPDSTLIPVARTGGVLTAGVFPSGGVIPGRASVMRMDGWTWEDMTITDDAGLIINWPRVRPINSPFVQQSAADQRKRSDEQLEQIADHVRAARAYFAARDADPTLLTDLAFEAMRPALQGRTPTFIFAQEYEQIVSAVTWALDENLKPIIVGGADALLAADLLKSNDIPVILTGTHRLPSRRDSPVDEAYRLPIELDAAGVRWCLSTGGGSFGAANERNLPLQAAATVAYGMDPAVALRSITLGVAEILGVSKSLGSIEAGKAATLIIADAPPLDTYMRVEHAFIDGRRIDITNKQTELSDKYREKYKQLNLIERD